MMLVESMSWWFCFLGVSGLLVGFAILVAGRWIGFLEEIGLRCMIFGVLSMFVGVLLILILVGSEANEPLGRLLH